VNLHGLEALVQLVEEGIEHVTHENLHDALPLLLEDPVADVHSVHAQVYGTGVVHRVVSGDVRGHIGKDHVGLSAETIHELYHRRIVGDVADYGLYTVDGLDVSQIDTYDPAFGPRALLRDLKPAAGTGTQVHHGVSGLEYREPVVDLDEFEGCPRTIVQLLGELVVVLVPSLGDPTVVQIGHTTPLESHRLKPTAPLNVITQVHSYPNKNGFFPHEHANPYFDQGRNKA